MEEQNKTNPFLDNRLTPYSTIPFPVVTVEDYEDAIMKGIRIHNDEINEIISNQEEPSFENTIAALDRSGVILDEAVLALGNLEAASGAEDVMALMMKMTPLISEHSSDILLNEDLWKRVKHVYDNLAARKDLSDEARRLTSETYRDFLESGASLEGDSKSRFRELKSRLSNLKVKFGQNVTNQMASQQSRMWITSADLDGLPESVREPARSAAREALAAEGKEDDASLYLITLFAPSYRPFMTYSSRRDLREKLYRMYNSRNNRGEFDNTAILRDIVNTRLEIANLMGKKSYAEYSLQRTMAATPENAYVLLSELKENYTDPMKREIREIEEFARQSEGEEFSLMPWDYNYWSEKLRADRYSFNDEDLKPYFELGTTIKGVFGLAEKLYGYSFVKRNDIPLYHPDVVSYEVFDDKGDTLGLLYADFFYREGKSPGAWMTEFRGESKDEKGERILPLISIVSNFPKPVEGKPVLLTPDEVRTFLHEFGHALHGLSSQARYRSLSGTNVYHDFVELFSQFNENYLSEHAFLDGFASHYQSGDKIPGDLLSKFLKSKRYGAAYACMRQLGFGYLDMAYHTLESPLAADCDLSHFENQAIKDVKVFEAVEGCMISPSFGHIFSGGYAAGYYGYKWSEVLDADAFSAFEESGIFDKDTGDRFKKMLESGGTVDPMQLYISFRGRKPTTAALLHRDGIVPISERYNQ